MISGRYIYCSPYRRATAEAVVAGSRLSATIRALSSSVQRRRRPTPVMSSIRRKPSAFVPVVALGLRIEAGPASYLPRPVILVLVSQPARWRSDACDYPHLPLLDQWLAGYPRGRVLP